jgi:hypothetical protein
VRAKEELPVNAAAPGAADCVVSERPSQKPQRSVTSGLPIVAADVHCNVPRQALCLELLLSLFETAARTSRLVCLVDRRALLVTHTLQFVHRLAAEEMIQKSLDGDCCDLFRHSQSKPPIDVLDRDRIRVRHSLPVHDVDQRHVLRDGTLDGLSEVVDCICIELRVLPESDAHHPAALPGQPP